MLEEKRSSELEGVHEVTLSVSDPDLWGGGSGVV